MGAWSAYVSQALYVSELWLKYFHEVISLETFNVMPSIRVRGLQPKPAVVRNFVRVRR